jgi:hypothetical protein
VLTMTAVQHISSTPTPLRRSSRIASNRSTRERDSSIESAHSDTQDDDQLDEDEQVQSKSAYARCRQQLSNEVTALRKRHGLAVRLDVDDGPLHQELKQYVTQYVSIANDVTTRRVSEAAFEVIADAGQIGDEKRVISWPDEDKQRYAAIREESLLLSVPSRWFWADQRGSSRYEFNHARMRLWANKECR